MHIREIFDNYDTALSFELFPPKTWEGAHELYNSVQDLGPLKPAYVSVTYGAGGLTRKFTHELVLKIKQETDIPVVAHLTCVDHSKDEIHKILRDYDQEGIKTIMALRGDSPNNGHFTPHPQGFNNAAEMVAYIKKHFPDMGIGVAGFPEGHPETPNRLLEIDYLKRKVDAGADYICTQMFFDNNYFYDFTERCEIAGIKIPICAGIMPIASINNMKRMAELSLGTNIPAKLLRALARADGAELVKRVGTQWAIQQVTDLIDQKVKGVHFYTLNKSKATQKIFKAVGIKDSDSLGHNHIDTELF
jgi:methylenetetrahydrofolate reductase (NADPH)